MLSIDGNVSLTSKNKDEHFDDIFTIYAREKANVIGVAEPVRCGRINYSITKFTWEVSRIYFIYFAMFDSRCGIILSHA